MIVSPVNATACKKKVTTMDGAKALYIITMAAALMTIGGVVGFALAEKFCGA